MNAGQRGAVTITTNWPGRGTDIKLGEGVLDLGGLCVIGTERHESRRIDNQLRGRAGRQGTGESQFYLSLEDELMRRFGSDRIKQVLERLNADDEDIVIKSRMLTRQKWKRLKTCRRNNYDTRKPKSFSTMTLCVNNVKSSTLSVTILSQRNVTLNLN